MSATDTLSPAEQGSLRHDLRTPFNALLGYAQMLRERADEGRIRELLPDLDAVEGASQELLEAINQALEPGKAVARASLGPLGERVREGGEPILRGLAALEARAADFGDDETTDDLARMRRAAESLLEMRGDRLASAKKEETAREVEFAAPRSREPLAGRVLVVDDAEANRDVLVRRLEREGCTAATAVDGADALRVLGQGGYDVVLLDLLMPGLSGYEVLVRLKADEGLRDLPVIMISALGDMEQVVRCIEAGAEEFLPKPFDPVLLRARVGACLEKKRFRDRELEYLRGVKSLEAAAAAVEARTFEPATLDSVAGRQDELGTLARMFQRMATEVQARERRLQEEVAQLRIEIDMAKLTTAVSEVTDVDFFRTAQEVGRKRREARRGS